MTGSFVDESPWLGMPLHPNHRNHQGTPGKDGRKANTQLATTEKNEKSLPKASQKQHDKIRAEKEVGQPAYVVPFQSNRQLTKPDIHRRNPPSSSSSSFSISGSGCETGDSAKRPPPAPTAWIRRRPKAPSTTQSSKSRRSLTKAMANFFFDVDSTVSSSKQRSKRSTVSLQANDIAMPAPPVYPPKADPQFEPSNTGRSSTVPQLATSHVKATTARIHDGWLDSILHSPLQSGIVRSVSKSSSSLSTDSGSCSAIVETGSIGLGLNADRFMSGALPVQSSNNARSHSQRLSSISSGNSIPSRGSRKGSPGPSAVLSDQPHFDAGNNTEWPTDAEAQDWQLQATLAESIRGQEEVEPIRSSRRASIPHSRSSSRHSHTHAAPLQPLDAARPPLQRGPGPTRVPAHPPAALGPFDSWRTRNPDIWSPPPGLSPSETWNPESTTLHPLDSVSNVSHRCVTSRSTGDRSRMESRHSGALSGLSRTSRLRW